ncbi:MAG: polyprenyl synthetase family protein [Clostridiales bacterium]|nr:polyprenyl synthetase family protein [Clostridiales bacterium]
MTDFDVRYREYLTQFEAYLEEYVDKLQTKPAVLGESMRYSLQSGGKRIRPVLMLACAEVLGVPAEEVLPFALALEMIHTYSLVHDDLPAMDNDDFRRGKPSNHKQFGEANAILAGDALLNEAYAICFAQCMKGEKYALASSFLNECAGMHGMIVGQSADLYFSESDGDVSAEDLFYIYEHKTGKLLLAPVAIASILAGNKYYLPFESFGKLLGRLFQMTDDILDVTASSETLGKTAGKDEKENKLTCVKVYGLESAMVRADMCARDCYGVLEGIDGDVSFLHDLVDYVLHRAN